MDCYTEDNQYVCIVVLYIAPQNKVKKHEFDPNMKLNVLDLTKRDLVVKCHQPLLSPSKTKIVEAVRSESYAEFTTIICTICVITLNIGDELRPFVPNPAPTLLLPCTRVHIFWPPILLQPIISSYS